MTPTGVAGPAKVVARSAARGPLAINPIIYAELCLGFKEEQDLDRVLAGAGVRRLPLPYSAAWPAAQAFAAYRKLRIRDTIDFPSMGAAVALRLAKGNKNGKKIETLRISITAVDVVPLPMDEVTDPLVGARLTDAQIEKIATDVESRCRPLRNVPLSPPYRKKMVGVYVRDLLTRLRDAA